MTPTPVPPPHPHVAGRCPACGWSSLFLGAGGYVTCARLDCPEPDAASTALGDVAVWDQYRRVQRERDAAATRAEKTAATLAEARRLVAEWLYDVNSGYGSDPGDLMHAFAEAGAPLTRELNAVETARAHAAEATQ